MVEEFHLSGVFEEFHLSSVVERVVGSEGVCCHYMSVKSPTMYFHLFSVVEVPHMVVEEFHLSSVVERVVGSKGVCCHYMSVK